MTLKDFSALTSDQQLDVLSDMGKRLSHRVANEYRITLYLVDDFFVELYFHRKKLRNTHLSAYIKSKLPEVYYESDEINSISAHEKLNQLTLKFDYHIVAPQQDSNVRVR